MTVRKKVTGYEIPCSPWTAEVLGAIFSNVYRGRGILHYWNGYLWWICGDGEIKP